MLKSKKTGLIINSDNKIIINSMYYGIHRKNSSCNFNRFHPRTTNVEEKKCDSFAHKIKTYNSKKYIFVTFYDKNNKELDQYLEIDESDKESVIFCLHSTLKYYLDPNMKRNVLKITVKRKLTLELFHYWLNFHIKVGNKKSKIISALSINNPDIDDIMKHIEELKCDDDFSSYDFSNITPDKIKLHEAIPPEQCIIG